MVINMKSIGNRIKELRKEKGMTQTQLAEKLNMTKSIVSAYETDVKSPSYNSLIKISEIFNVTTDYLLGTENRKSIDLEGLSDVQIDLIKNLIYELKKNN